MIAVGAEAAPRPSTRAPHARVPTPAPSPDGDPYGLRDVTSLYASMPALAAGVDDEVRINDQSDRRRHSQRGAVLRSSQGGLLAREVVETRRSTTAMVAISARPPG